MSNPSYTEDEIIHVLNKHREEKYKSSGRQSLESSEQEELSSLRQQLATLRKYTQQAQEETVKFKQGLSETLDKLNETETDRQRLIRENGDLQNRLQQLENPNDAHHQLQEALELNYRQKQRIERMTALIQEKEAKVTELQQFEYSFKRAGEWKIKQQGELDLEKEKTAKLEAELRHKNQEMEDVRQRMMQMEKMNQILKEQVDSSAQDLKRSQEEVFHLRQASVQLVEQHRESERHLEDMEALLTGVQTEKKELQDELTAIVGQFDALRSRVQDSHQKLEAHRQFISDLQMEMQKATEEKALLSRQLSEKTKLIEGFDQELELIKQTLMRGMREAKDIEIRYQECVSEKVSAVNKSNQLQHLIERQREELAKYKDELHQNRGRLEMNAKVKEEKDQHIQKLQDLLIQREHEIESHSQALHQAAQQKTLIEEDLRVAREAIEDSEQRFKLAQQHLAKKVKETSQLNETLEEQRLSIQDLTTQLTHAKDKIGEVQTHSEMMIQQEKKMHEQLSESLKLAESQMSKWEAKYFAMHEKWQEMDERNRELRSLEEKYNQMQSLLSGLGNFIAPTPTPQAPVPVPTLEIPQAPKATFHVVQEVKQPKVAEAQTLFDAAPAGAGRSKKSLFD